MTEHGLPIVNGAPACPFVALEDDRDARSPGPDHDHRCYAEPRPAPRALAHQEAYCLSSAFPVCPTFQDWARREAATTRAEASAGREAAPPPPAPPASRSVGPLDREGRRLAADASPPYEPRRNPPRDWAAPPPWSLEEPGRSVVGADAEAPSFLADRTGPDEWGSRARGLAGSPADRLAREAAGDGPDLETPDSRDAGVADERSAPPPGPTAAGGRDPSESRQPADGRRVPDPGHVAPPHGGRRRDRDAEELFGPAWEGPQRFEAYPTLRTRMGISGFPGLSGVALAAIAVVLAALALFFLPTLFGVGDDPGTGGGPTASASAAPNPTAAPTPTPAPTPTVYIVKSGDTLSRIATRFGLTLEQLLEANPQITNPNRISAGDEVTIPLPPPDELPGEVDESPAP